MLLSQPDIGRKGSRREAFRVVENVHGGDYEASSAANYARVSRRLSFDERAQIMNRQVNGRGRLVWFEQRQDDKSGGCINQRSSHAAVYDAVILFKLIAYAETQNGFAALDRDQLKAEHVREWNGLERIRDTLPLNLRQRIILHAR
jgi:hypothetical protein